MKTLILKINKITISPESMELYQDWKDYNLNDKAKRYDTEIVKLARRYYQEYPELFKSVRSFLNDNRKIIISKLQDKEQYKKIIENFNIMSGAIDIIHLNQIVNEI